MLVIMPLEDESKLGKLNDKNSNFTRVAKYVKTKDYLLVLLYTPYKFNLPQDEVYKRFEKVFE